MTIFGTVLLGSLLVGFAERSDSGAAEAGTSSAVPSAAEGAARARPRCPYARRGVAFYRGRFTHWQAGRGAGVPGWRKPRNCADARYLATLWAKRSLVSRRATEQYRKRIAAREAQHPKWIALRLLGGDREQWGCLMSIVRVENASMDPTLDFGHGHGNVYEAYGIPQANPGTKMATHGPDWRTNPETQLRWMIDYCRGRYGSVCGAAYARRTNGYY